MKSDAFPSLADLRSAHSDLLQSIPDSEDKLNESDVGRIREFLRRAAGAGKMMDTATDRKVAQGLLDYWSATLYSQGHRQASGSTGSERLPREETVLAEFETATIGQVAQAADAWFRTVPDADRNLVRRILLRLVRLPAEGRKFQATIVPRSGLQQLGVPAQVDAVLKGLAEAGIIRIEPGDQPENDLISLRYEALSRLWGPYAAWLDQRLRFRDRASYWNVSHHDRSTLIRDELLEEAVDYPDKNELEHKFVTASQGRERDENVKNRNDRYIFRGVAACAIVLAAVATGFWIKASRSARQANNALASEQIHKHDALRAGAALKAKFKLTYMVTITRTLAEIGTASSDAERQIAVRRLEILKDVLRDDPDFSPILSEVAGDLVRIKKGTATTEDVERISIMALKVGHQLKCNALKVQDPDLVNELKSQRAVAFQTVQFVGQQIVSTFEKHSFTDAEPYTKEFWLMYWGELALLEGSDVESAMKNFGDKLKEMDRIFESGLPDPKNLLDIPQRERFKSLHLRAKLRTLRSTKLTVANPAKFLTDLFSQKVPAEQVKEARRILDEQLIPALELELKGEISPCDVPPAAY
jgi:hypothetical protein